MSVMARIVMLQWEHVTDGHDEPRLHCPDCQSEAHAKRLAKPKPHERTDGHRCSPDGPCEVEP